MNEEKDFLGALLRRRQSIRFFDVTRNVPLEMIEAILDDAQQAPNDCNHQTWKFIVVTDPALKKCVVDSAGSCEPARRAPVLVVPIIEGGWNHNKFSIIQTLAAATNTLILSAKARGLSSVWMAGIGNTEAVRRLLSIPPEYIIDCFVGLGFAVNADLPYPKAPRQPVTHIYSLNTFSFDADHTYPLRPARRYDFWKISNQHNPYALWHPKDWTWGQIAFFRGNAVWANSPSPTLHRSRRLAKEFEREVELATKHIGSGKVLIILPYSGAYSAELLKTNPSLEVTHFELSPNHEEIIRKRLKTEGVAEEIPFYASADAKVPLPDASFDAVCMFQTLESVPAPEVLVAEAYRLLKPGGRIVVTARNKWSWLFLSFLRTMRKETVWNFGPFWPISPRKLKTLLGGKFSGIWSGISPLPKRIGVPVATSPFRFLCRLLVFTGTKR